MTNNNNENIISYSHLQKFLECGHAYKLRYIDKVSSFDGNEYTIFGKALHRTLEKLSIKEININNEDDIQDVFVDKFLSELKRLPDPKTKKILEDIINDNIDLSVPENKKRYDTVYQMLERGPQLSKLGVLELEKKFGEYKVLAAERKLSENITFTHYKELIKNVWKFKGYIDLDIQTPDDVVHICDWKGCSWGWSAWKKNDKKTLYQLVLYKIYLSQALQLPLEKFETHFVLAKRTATKELIEIVDISSGKKRTENALKLLAQVVYNIERGKFIKNRLSCKYCEFFDTQHCPNPRK